jgi:hypothetical protein
MYLATNSDFQYKSCHLGAQFMAIAIESRGNWCVQVSECLCQLTTSAAAMLKGYQNASVLGYRMFSFNYL